jgi:hypothetical protein
VLESGDTGCADGRMTIVAPLTLAVVIDQDDASVA